MGLSFSKFLAIHEIFLLDKGRVLSLVEAVGISADATAQAQAQLADVRATYKPDPFGADHLAAACAGLKPAAVVSYFHHPESPAAAVVSDELRKDSDATAGEIQAELLKHGFQVRPDFHIIHMNLPNYAKRSIIVGGRAAVEELWKLFQCQYFLDIVSSPDHSEINADAIAKATRQLRGQCNGFCTRGMAGMQCKPIHKRIGQLLGYTDEQVDDFVNNMTGGYDHLPDLQYPVEIPRSLAGIPRRKIER